jgi:hypothetical protein
MLLIPNNQYRRDPFRIGKAMNCTHYPSHAGCFATFYDDYVSGGDSIGTLADRSV